MGIRGEIFSNKVILPNRTYFFNVKENRMGDLYLNIVESKNRDNGGFERQSVILFADDLQEFLKGFDESLKVLEKATRDKKKNPSRKDFEPKVRKTSSGEKEDFNKSDRRGGKRDEHGGKHSEHGSRHSERGGRVERGGERGRDEKRRGGRGEFGSVRSGERSGGRGGERGGHGGERSGGRGGRPEGKHSGKREGGQGKGKKRVVVRREK